MTLIWFIVGSCDEIVRHAEHISFEILWEAAL